MDQDQRITQLLDKADIMDLKHAYLRAADACDPGRMVEHFTVDGFWASYVPGSDAVVGRDAIRDWYAQRLSSVVASSHHVSNVEITFNDPDTATLRCYLYSWQRFADHPETSDRHRFARYVDTWVRLDDRWQQRTLTCLVAGEYCSDATPRIGEYFSWDQ